MADIKVHLVMEAEDAEFLVLALRRASRADGAGTAQFRQCCDLIEAVASAVVSSRGRPDGPAAGPVPSGKGY